MKFSRQALLGVAMMIGGSVVLFAMVQQIGAPDQAQAPEPTVIEQPTSSASAGQSSANAAQPLTTDIETEQRILAQKQKEREARVAKQEKRAQEFLVEQEQAEAEALAKARAENQQYADNAIEPVSDDASPEAAAQSTPIAKPTVKPRPDTSIPNDDSGNNSNSNTAPKPQTPIVTSPTTADSNKQTDEAKKLATQKEQREAEVQKEKLAAQKRAERQKAEVEAKEDQKAKQRREAEQAKTKKAELARKEAERKKAEQLKAEQNKAQEKKAAEEKAKAAKRAPASPSEYVVQRGDGLIRLAREYNVPVEALAQANDMKPSANLRVGQELKIPSRRQIARLEREAEEAKQREEAARTAQQRLVEARREAARGEAKGSFGVQVALADNQAKADEVAKKMRAAGYKVSTSPTSRGVRVIVGPEKGKSAALALKDKINADPRTGVNKAWVLYWR